MVASPAKFLHPCSLENNHNSGFFTPYVNFITSNLHHQQHPFFPFHLYHPSSRMCLLPRHSDMSLKNPATTQQPPIASSDNQVRTYDNVKCDSQLIKRLCNECPSTYAYHKSNLSSFKCVQLNIMARPEDIITCGKDEIHNVILKDWQESSDMESLSRGYLAEVYGDQLSLITLNLIWILPLITLLVGKLMRTKSFAKTPPSSSFDNQIHTDVKPSNGLNLSEERELPPKEKDVSNKKKNNNRLPGTRSLMQTNKLIELSNGNKQGMYSKHMPWFGIDIGGSLVKVVFFDPVYATHEEAITLRRIRRYLKSSKAYGTTGKRDVHLELPNCVINKRLGCLHFIRFATSQMQEFLLMVKNKHFADIISNVCATGGGACKFEQIIKTDLGITLQKSDELDSLIHGIHYVDKFNSSKECYFFRDPLDDKKCLKEPYDFSQPYPYLVVNIGSGVSILAVYSSTSYSRISGSSIGGGTFLGLCCLLTGCRSFDEAIRLAKTGTSAKVDKLVKDIYGGDYLKLNLPGDTVASSFGNMMHGRLKDVTKNDLARALLEMVTVNIGSLARVWAATQNIDRLVFIGNFLRFNQLSMKLLSYAVDYWSEGAMKALFLEHEGYFGAVGCFVESTVGNLDGVDDN